MYASIQSCLLRSMNDELVTLDYCHDVNKLYKSFYILALYLYCSFNSVLEIRRRYNIVIYATQNEGKRRFLHDESPQLSYIPNCLKY